jgi:hypothetical protein
MPRKRRTSKERHTYPDLIKMLINGEEIDPSEEAKQAFLVLEFFDDPPGVPADARARARKMTDEWHRKDRWARQLRDGLPLTIQSLMDGEPIPRTEENRRILVGVRFDEYPGLTQKQRARADALVKNWSQWIKLGGALVPPPPGAVVLK